MRPLHAVFVFWTAHEAEDCHTVRRRAEAQALLYSVAEKGNRYTSVISEEHTHPRSGCLGETPHINPCAGTLPEGGAPSGSRGQIAWRSKN